MGLRASRSEGLIGPKYLHSSKQGFYVRNYHSELGKYTRFRV